MEGFNPERLREIRIVKKMTLNELALNLGITKQAVSKYECGRSIPSPETIDKIMNVLDVPRQFLTKKSVTPVGLNSLLFFRTVSSTTKTEIEFAETVSKWSYEVLHGICSFESISNINLPEIDIEMSISEKAAFLRQYWGLGDSPIENMISTLENNGIFVFVINSSELHTDAYSRIINNIPIVVLNEYKGTAVRQRFSLAHELGHLVLHRNLSETDFEFRAKEIEKEASLFASHFLMPPAKFSSSIVSCKLDYFLRLKREWKVSIAAMIYHCKHLKILDDKQSELLQMQMSKKWGRKTEPFDNELVFEKPSYLFERIQKYVIDKISFENFFGTSRLPIDAMERICFLPEGYFSKYFVDIPLEGTTAGYEQLSLF